MVIGRSPSWKKTTAELYCRLQAAVDPQIVNPGLVPSSNGELSAPAPRTTNSPVQPRDDDAWKCSEKQQALIVKIVAENNLDKAAVDALTQERFGVGVRQLNKIQASALITDHSYVELPISSQSWFAEVFVGSLGGERFCETCVHLVGPTRAFELHGRIRREGEADRADRQMAHRAFAMRSIVLMHLRGNISDVAADTCDTMACDEVREDSIAGQQLRRGWRYARALSFFEGSCDAVEKGDVRSAQEFARRALAAANVFFDEIAGDKPLVKFQERDEFGEDDSTGELLLGLPNLVTSVSETE